MNLSIKPVSENKFEITIKDKLTTKHIIILNDKLYKYLTNKKISKKKLVEYSFQFLLDREPNTSILSIFELDMISKYFPEYENEIKKYIQS